MDRWRGRVAVVTGASSGIGAAIAYQLQDAGVHVVGFARRVDKIPEAVETARLEALSRNRSSLGSFLGKTSSPGKLDCVKCDVSKEEDVLAAFKWVKDNTKGIDILVNNAGVVGDSLLTESTTEEWRQILDINILGLSMCTREAIKQMKERGVDDGHIVHISSVAGHIPPILPGFAMYGCSKHAVRVLTEGLRRELAAAKSKIRVTEISPGLVKTDILDSLKNMQKDVLLATPYLFSEDIADTVLYALSTPPHVQIHEIIVQPLSDLV